LTANFGYLGFEGHREMASCPRAAQLHSHWQTAWREPILFHPDSRMIESFLVAIEQKSRCGKTSHSKTPAWDYFPVGLATPLLLSGSAVYHLLMTATAAGSV
jgi:hypothetical protein